MIWAVLLGCAAVPVSIALTIRSSRNWRESKSTTKLFRPIGAALLPFIILAYGGAALIGYAVWCERVRHVDPGIGDGWAVPVANNYSFWMIDVPEHGSLGKEDDSSAAVVSEVVELAEVGDRIIGRSTSKGLFILNTRSGELHAFLESDAVKKEISALPTLESANDFYIHRRWELLDLVAVTLIGSLGLALILLGYRFFIRPPLVA
ncbi:MAG: hypothetical protein QOD75_2729 [Blastocatellia bacterium]|nr:hypothetical protein [Blastocatellia bacterium]